MSRSRTLNYQYDQNKYQQCDIFLLPYPCLRELDTLILSQIQDIISPHINKLGMQIRNTFQQIRLDSKFY